MSTFASATGAIRLGDIRGHVHAGDTIGAGAITNAKLANSAVTSAKLVALTSWSDPEIATSFVYQTSHFPSSVVTGSKIASNAIGTSQMANADSQIWQLVAPVTSDTEPSFGQRGFMTVYWNRWGPLIWQIGNEQYSAADSRRLVFWSYNDSSQWQQASYIDHGGNLVPGNYVYTTSAMWGSQIRGTLPVSAIPDNFAEVVSTAYGDGETNYPIGTTITYYYGQAMRNEAINIWKSTAYDNFIRDHPHYTQLAGTWRHRGGTGGWNWNLAQRVA